MTTEFIMVRALERGLSLRDFDLMTVGMIIDYIIEYDNLMSDEEEDSPAVRMASQKDFDSF